MAGACECGNEILGFIKRGIFGLTEDSLASQEGLCCMDLVSLFVILDCLLR